MNMLLGLMEWYAGGITLAGAWIGASAVFTWGWSKMNGQRRGVVPETWIEGPRGRVELNGRGWPKGVEHFADYPRGRLGE